MSVVKALWNALRGRHKYGATNGNQYAARRSSMISLITRRTRNSIGSSSRVRVHWGAAIFDFYMYIFRFGGSSMETLVLSLKLMLNIYRNIFKFFFVFFF